MFDPNRVRKIENTDVFGTIRRAADYAKAAHDRRPTLILLSDMENSTAEMRMERSDGIPSSQWIAVRRSANRLPEMQGVCVVVAGAASETQRAAAIREFWVRYFAASGTTLATTNYRAFVPDATELRC
jgi:predicted amidohydrolase